MKYNNRSIRDVIDDMRKLGLSLMYFYGHKNPFPFGMENRMTNVVRFHIQDGNT